MLSAIRSRWGQRLGQKKRQVSYWAEKYGKSPDFARNQDFLVAETGLEHATSGLRGSLTHKSESFRLRFVLFAAIRSTDFPLFPSSPARFFRILGQKWVKHGALTPTPTASRRPSRRRRQQDRPRRPHHSCSPAEYR